VKMRIKLERNVNFLLFQNSSYTTFEMQPELCVIKTQAAQIFKAIVFRKREDHF